MEDLSARAVARGDGTFAPAAAPCCGSCRLREPRPRKQEEEEKDDTIRRGKAIRSRRCVPSPSPFRLLPVRRARFLALCALIFASRGRAAAEAAPTASHGASRAGVSAGASQSWLHSDNPKAELDFPPLPVRDVDDFLLTRRLGTGKFSDVFEAVDTRSESHRVEDGSTAEYDPPSSFSSSSSLVVIKCLKPVSDRKVRREVAVLRRANHGDDARSSNRDASLVSDDPTLASSGAAANVAKLLGIVMHRPPPVEMIDGQLLHPRTTPARMPSLLLEHAGPRSQWLCHPTTAVASASPASAGAGRSPLTDFEIRYFLCHLLVALADLHRLGIFHRDVKPRNVLVNRDLVSLTRHQRNPSSSADFQPLTLIDLGLADFYQPGEDYNVRVASRHYKAPELLLNYTRYTPAVDLWGFGCMLAGLLLRREPLFRGRDNADQLLKIVLVLGTVDLRLYLEKLGIPAPSWLDGTAAENDAEGVGSAPLPSGRISDWTSLRRNHHHHRRTGAADQDCGDVRQVPPDGIDLLCRLLVYDHSLRYTAQQALEHPFFDPVRRRVLAEVEAQRHADGRLIRGRRRGQEQRDRPPGGNAPSDLSFLSAPPPRSYDHHHQ